MKRLDMYVQRRGITVEILSGPDYVTEVRSDGSLWEHHAYELELRNADQGTMMTLPWKQGIGITRDPDERPELILDCLIREAWSFETAGSFEYWAESFDYDTDSRAAKATYQEVEKLANNFLDFLGGKPELEMLATQYEAE